MLDASHYINEVQLSVKPCSSVKPPWRYQLWLGSLIKLNGIKFHYNCFILHQTDNSLVHFLLYNYQNHYEGKSIYTVSQKMYKHHSDRVIVFCIESHKCSKCPPPAPNSKFTSPTPLYLSHILCLPVALKTPLTLLTPFSFTLDTAI
jgi:hypothetical protein